VAEGFERALASIGAEVDLVPTGETPQSVAAGWPAIRGTRRPSSEPPSGKPSEGHERERSPRASLPPPAGATADASGIGPVDVWILGFAGPVEDILPGLQQAFGLAETQARMVATSVPAAVKVNVEPADAAEYVRVLRSIGARIQVLPAGRRPDAPGQGRG
jgi:hypothetical protein